MNTSFRVSQLSRSRRLDRDLVEVNKYCFAGNITESPSVDGYYKQLKTGVDASWVKHIAGLSGHHSAFLFINISEVAA